MNHINKYYELGVNKITVNNIYVYELYKYVKQLVNE